MSPQQHAILVVDLAFGDCGKGAVVDFLARRCAGLPHAPLVVRFNGGPQAGHNVLTPDGRHHTFSQFGSGSFVPGVPTLLSRFMLVEPYALFNEAVHLRSIGVTDALDRLSIDARCPIITPAHQAANRLRELARAGAAHGTCGLGIGELMQDTLDHPELTLRAADLADRPAVARRLRAFRDLKLDQLRDAVAALGSHPRATQYLQTLLDSSWIDAAVDVYAELARRVTIVDDAQVLQSAHTLIFEGAQGVLLDENFGFHPHTTWSTTTFANADALLDEAGHAGRRTRLGVLRSYFTRHGAGPLVTEDPSLRPALPEPHNADAGWQGNFRTGPFDALAARYALAASGGVDALALTHLDRLSQLPPRICDAYRTEGPDDLPLSDCFIHERGRITSIRVRRPPDLHHQQRLTAALRRCRPSYCEVATDPEAFVSRIAHALHCPVSLVSSGPTAHHKHILRPDLLP
jgi:adenylosuccinate synthase